jgi:hypothetical protein
MSEKSYLYTYSAYGLNVASQIPVTGFEPVPIDKADVYIHAGQVPESLDNITNKGVLYQATNSEFLLRVEQVAAYYVKNGNEIVVQPLGKATKGEVSAFLTGTAFGALLHQRRRLPLHASTVIFNNNCLVFAGISGAGKTTMAAALVKAGGMLVADDISVIDFAGEKPAVCPAFPLMKIWDDSLKHLGLSSAGLEPVRGELKKYYLPVHEFSRVYTGISNIFVLNTHNQPGVELKPLLGVDKFRVLKKHTYLFRGIPKTGLEQNHFMLVNQLASQVPVTLLTRPNGEFNTDKLVHIITETLQKGNHG